MESLLYEIDLGADIELVLKSPNSQQIVRVISPVKDGQDAKQDPKFENPPLVGNYGLFDDLNLVFETESGDVQPVVKEVRFRVSSRHLILASRTFRSMLEGPWSEATSSSNNSIRQISASDWDAVAFAVVLDIIHGRHREVPYRINLGLLTRIATIVDYYECHEVVQIFAHVWLPQTRCQLPNTYSNEALMWLYVSWVFSEEDFLSAMTEIILRRTDGLLEMDAKDLPLAGILSQSILPHPDKLDMLTT
ncbi:hypothetical protein IL306_001923 [Fusarium sp. DS 682]|nr:hypothetical protein IL306_001923 [Fusarium sp. DS 682]